MIGLYHYPPAWLHRLPAGGKLGALAAATIALFFIERGWIAAVCVAAAAGLYLTLGRDGLRRLRGLMALAPLLAIVGVVQYFASGLEAAVVSIGRLLTMILLADLVTLSTTMHEMLDTLLPLFKPFERFGLRAASVALALALVVRFVPLVLDNWSRLNESWRARSGRSSRLGLVWPMIVGTLRMADHVGEALDARRMPRTICERKP